MTCDDDFGYLINQASRLVKGKVNRKLSEIGLTFPQFAIVMNLQAREKQGAETCPVTPASIAEQLKYDRPTVTGIIDRLVKQGLITRETNPLDRRSQSIKLTPQAREHIDTMIASFAEVNAISLDGFQAAEIAELKKYLLRVIDNLSDGQDGPCSRKEV